MKIKYLIFGLILICIALIFNFFGKKDNSKEISVPENILQITYINADEDKIKVELPTPGAVTGKDFSVIGVARGMWYFEATFPIDVLDKNGNKLVQTYASAEGEWMTENFVPFKSEIKIPETYIGPATLVLHRSNASGLPEHDASISFPFIIEY